MLRPGIRALLGALVLLVGSGQTTLASTTVALDGLFIQHFGGQLGDDPICAPGELICGTGMVDGFGKARDAFLFSDEDGFQHEITLADGSSVLMSLDFVDRTNPGRSGDAPGDHVSLGNPDGLVFDTVVVSATGRFAGASGEGTTLLKEAGDTDQITVAVSLVVP
jgi:hypothetical protein